MLFAPSRAELDAWPRALGLLAVAAALEGSTLAAALAEASRRLTDTPLDQRRRLSREVRRPAGVPGWPPGTGDALRETIEAGPRATADLVLARLPADLASLLRDPDLDPLDLVAAHLHHGVVSAADIAVIASSLAAATGDGSPVLRRLAGRLPGPSRARRRMPLGRAWAIAERVEAALSSLDDPPGVEVLGSVRRFAPVVGDLDVLLTHDEPAGTLARAIEALGPTAVRHRGPTRAVVQLDGFDIGLRATTPAAAALILLWYTGTAAHLDLLRARAAAAGLALRHDALLGRDGRPLPCRSEPELYAALDLPWIAPELRHGEDEIARAAAGTLPVPVAVADIRGDLHTHTLWSDGRDSVDAVVYAARSLGYEYVAITDHSPSAAAARVLTLERLARQAAEVERVRALVPEVQVLHGVEADILEDGSLDLPDHVMAGLDLVLASLHESFGHPPDRLLARYERAMRHPLVDIVTHPANRVPGRHEGHAIDFDALFRLAVETGTAVEVDGAPGHLDLDGHLARRAAEAGATLVVDSDGHDASRLGRHMRLGIGTARRGGVSAGQVLNTRPLAEVRAFQARKRSRRA